MTLRPPTPAPSAVISRDGTKITTFDFGDPDGAVVLAVHGFASSALANWSVTGWIRDLTRAGLRVIAIDQRGHGGSDKPHDPSNYTMDHLVDDVLAVADTYMLDTASLLGYSLGARVSWRAAIEHPHRFDRAVLGGMPAGDPLSRFRLEEAREHIRSGVAIDDKLTATFVAMAETLPGNDLEALVSLVEGLRGGPQAWITDTPTQPLLLATGGEDPLLDDSRRLAEAAPDAEFLEIAGRSHFNATTAKEFREAATRFLTAPR
ncbi:alpha-beta hydrolase superfamily lysophospholipase [Homoserinimonas aerilata]|uniref:Alpha-beta hydrolase superfamily lysophospholipase n=1 Tax=Homoserinimonas aerilata TaxID=1162970 RepID=A0A542YHS4_9MICO|nr:alpha/beta hydrolase [Homoserinimonas aerilata]TQL47657.1 alpha-beta hydrolase superfamily lysophospholipase [Homoserinimonas aerilata]